MLLEVVRKFSGRLWGTRRQRRARCSSSIFPHVIKKDAAFNSEDNAGRSPSLGNLVARVIFFGSVPNLTNKIRLSDWRCALLNGPEAPAQRRPSLTQGEEARPSPLCLQVFLLLARGAKEAIECVVYLYVESEDSVLISSPGQKQGGNFLDTLFWKISDIES